MEVIEQERIRRRFSQAVNTYDDHADAQKRICAHLVQLLTAYTSSHFRRVLEIGCGSGGFTRLLKQECQIEEWVLNDLCETWQSAIEELFPSATPLFLAGDAERLAFPRHVRLDCLGLRPAMDERPSTFLHKLIVHPIARRHAGFQHLHARQPSRDQGTDRRRAHLSYRRTIKGVVIHLLPDRP